jgi:hypothetical protein
MGWEWLASTKDEFAKQMIAKGAASERARIAGLLETSTVPPPLGDCGPSCDMKSDAACGSYECWMRFWGAGEKEQ